MAYNLGVNFESIQPGVGYRGSKRRAASMDNTATFLEQVYTK
jgi:hypothetical protein